MELRNIAIIAHVDHGKTTLVDAMLKQAKALSRHDEGAERIMDSNDLERERGITILAKNTAVEWGGVKINIVDTPGHADFGGEVERALSMVDGVLLLVDAAEGPMPQTRFVLKKAIEAGLKPIVVINKVDKKDARPDEVLNETFDLMAELGASEEQLDFPYLYAIGREGAAWLGDRKKEHLEDLFQTILESIPAPRVEEGPFQLRVANLDYSNFLGKIALGKVHRGTIRKNETVAIVGEHQTRTQKVLAVFTHKGLERLEVEEVSPGDIVAIAGMEGVEIGDTIASREAPEALPRLAVDEPTVSITVTPNTSPFAGREGKFVTSRQIRERLMHELETNVALRVIEITPDTFELHGRGELHLSVLLETMRREGYEFSVGQPSVLYKEIEGQIQEPYEYLVLDVPEAKFGPVMEALGTRKAQMAHMEQEGGRIRAEFKVPARALFGFRTNFLTLTAGEGVMSHSFDGYGPHVGGLETRTTGSAVAMEAGVAYAYSLYRLQERISFFIEPGTEVYVGMIVGENARDNDLNVNVNINKKLTNVRAAGSDENIRLIPPRKFTLEEALEFLAPDELLEVTPKSLRLRKRVLDPAQRKRAEAV
ncbi:translational GTPase TypA [Meiothermus granaticius]|uniref:Large ribosomal subunit assembly factor BipA n=1 Tax=Meiothermus granaticius NBRC 107808 TaxID=1227551 RepID=A0A399F6S5_9DEIN|nr:translational GTPase TypA [Meiothermus granaticius]RIH92397.1 GTP-binding protein TypA/BipA [Meiothermus granaticius NBRC 107808]GEM87432.1 GTP-binding protein [Meiothermus granaticius NBRC 107808]